MPREGQPCHITPGFTMMSRRRHGSLEPFAVLLSKTGFAIEVVGDVAVLVLNCAAIGDR